MGNQKVLTITQKKQAFVFIRHGIHFPYTCMVIHCVHDQLFFASMVHLIETESEDMYTYIKLFAHRLTMTPTPPPGRVAIVSTHSYHLTLRKTHSKLPSTLLWRVAILCTVKYPKQPPTPSPGRMAIVCTNSKHPPPKYSTMEWQVQVPMATHHPHPINTLSRERGIDRYPQQPPTLPGRVAIAMYRQ